MMCKMAKWCLLLFQITRSLTLAWAILTVSGCTTLSVTDMLPDVNKAKLISTRDTLRIGQIRSGEIKTDFMHRSLAPSGTIAPEVFEETLYQALGRSGIFARLVKSGEADLHLDADLVSQEIITGYPVTATLFVRYRLTDAHSGKTRWEKSIVSIGKSPAGKSPASEIFRDRHKLANERAVQENLKWLLMYLSSVVAATKEQAEGVGHLTTAGGHTASEEAMAGLIAQDQPRRSTLQSFAVLAAQGDIERLMDLVIPAAKAGRGEAMVRNRIKSEVIPFFVDYKALNIKGMAPALFPDGRTGVTYYAYNVTPTGLQKPFVIWLLEDGGRTFIGQIEVNRCVPDRHLVCENK